MKYRKILIKYNAYFKKTVFHSRENIKKVVSHSHEYILKRKRNATLSKMVVLSFSSNNPANDNEIAKYRYLPCIQHQNQTAVNYGWRAATRNVRQPPFLKSQSSKIVPTLRKKRFKPTSVLEKKIVDRIKSGTFMFLSTFILSKLRL